MQTTAEKEIADVQLGVRSGVGTRDQIFNLCILFQKARETSSPLYVTFITYKKAFDSIKHTTLWDTLKNMGLNNNMSAY